MTARRELQFISFSGLCRFFEEAPEAPIGIGGVGLHNPIFLRKPGISYGRDNGVVVRLGAPLLPYTTPRAFSPAISASP